MIKGAPINKHNWPKLKQEFLTGDWLEVRQFLRDKGISINNVSQVSGWAKEKKQLSIKAAKMAESKLVRDESGEIVKVRERHARMARFMQLKGMEVIKNSSTENLSPDEARKMMVAGLDQERKALGIDGNGSGGVSSLTQINVNVAKTNLDKLVEGLNYEGILQLIADLKRERDGRFVSATSNSSPRKAQEGEII
jgi:hypothetical protein